MNPHLEQAVVQKGGPLTDHNPVILAFHGRNQSPDFVVDVFERLAWPDATFFAPAAANNTWYPNRFMDAIESNEPYLTYTLASVDMRVKALAAQGVDKKRLILLGFSQGACLVAEYAVRHPARYGGLAIFTGGVIGPPGHTWPQKGSFDATPTLITTCDTDEWVPVGRVHETIALFRQMGAAVTEQVFTGREHLVNDDEIQMARDLFMAAPRN